MSTLAIVIGVSLLALGFLLGRRSVPVDDPAEWDDSKPAVTRSWWHRFPVPDGVSRWR